MDVMNHTEQQLLKHQLLTKGTRLVAAVSGGPDSMALFHVLHQICLAKELDLVAVHVNHRFRVEESKEEAELVRSFVTQLGRQMNLAEFDLPSYIAKTGENSQAAARKKRYGFFRQICRQLGAAALLTAHHADDQAETIFMRLLKGASVKSLTGIQAIRRDESGFYLLRPLLDISKQQLLDYCHHHQITYAVDQSNEQLDYLRNRVRLEVFPYLRKIQPQLTEAINRLGKIASLENDWMENEAQRFIQLHGTLESKSVTLDRLELLKLHPALQKRVIPLILNYLATYDEQIVDYKTVENIYRAIHQKFPPSLELHLSADLYFIREYDRLYVKKKIQQRETTFHHEIAQFPIRLDLKEVGWTIVGNLLQNGQRSVPASPHEIYLDADQLQLPLTIRSRCPGDRMQIVGMKGTKKIKDIFIDDKVPPSERNKIPVFVDAQGEIIWVAGIRYSGTVTPNKTSQNILHIVCHQDIC